MNAFKQVEDEILARMFDATFEYGWSFGLRFFEPDIHREVARGILRKLRNDGKVEHHKGLWSEDGEPAGSGYCIAHQLYREMSEARDIEHAMLIDVRRAREGLSKHAAALLTRLEQGRFYPAYDAKVPAAMTELREAGLVTRAGRATQYVACFVPAHNYTPMIMEKFE